MNARHDSLDQSTHARIFAEKVAPESGLNKATSSVHPHAVILAGQPGAGKGSLVNAAVRDFRGDLVIIDPDQLREYHPNFKNFRETHPYTWSGLTHPDAAQWAAELREMAVAGQKNLIVDTTLGNGDNAVKMINDLRSRGYAVEVRVMAAHRLESELGVDQRFTDGIAEKGYGRYVPQEVQSHVYDALPESLDKIRAHTDAPIEIFNREGKKLYDSRTDLRAPGEVLRQARDVRMTDIKLTRSLSNVWNAQQTLHENLPDALAQNPKVAEPIAQHLLRERSALPIVDGVIRDTSEARVFYNVARQRSAGLALKGAGAAAVVYDTAATAKHARDLLHEGNRFGAQSEVLHFGGRNLGMLGGAELGFVAGAALGVESGPGLFVTGAIGGVAGAIGGERIAAAIDNHRIYTQDDKDGKAWHFDPQQPAHGWTRTVESSRVDTNPDDFVLRPLAHRSQMFTADAALSNELNYKASGSAVEMALNHTPRPQDAYAVPASSQDTPSLRASPWTRDATTHQWGREVTTAVLEHGMANTHREPANPYRTAELDRASQTILAQNATETKHAIAARYQSAFDQYGWRQFGAPPEAVTNALRAPIDTQRALNGDTYTRGANDQWSTPHWYGDDTAQGNLKDALNDARQRQVHEHSPGVATSFKDTDHPQHALYAKLKDVMPQQTSEARLAQATAACHTHHITADNLGRIKIDAAAMSFAASWPPGRVAQADLTQPPPTVQQSMQHVQAYDQQQTQMMSEIRAQNALINQQGQHGPAMGGR